MYTITVPEKLTTEDLDVSATLTATAFGRSADQQNYEDTRQHLVDADQVQLAHNEAGRLTGFAAYRYLWRHCR